MKPLVRKTLEIAWKEVGVQESEGHNNTGKRVEEYLRATGLGGGYPWCNAFCGWCAGKAAAAMKTVTPLVITADCDVSLAFARKHDILRNRPEAGDQFLRMRTPNDANHTGFVRSVSETEFATIEGNTNDGGNREGYGVFARERPLSGPYKFIRWSALVPAEAAADSAAVPAPKTFALFLGGVALGSIPDINGTAFAPVRLVGNALGLSVAWNHEDQAISVGGKEYPGDVSMKDGKAHVPVRKLADFLGLGVSYDPATRTVTLSKP